MWAKMCFALSLYFAVTITISLIPMAKSEDKTEVPKGKINLTALGIPPSECRKMMMVTAKKQMKVFVNCSKEIQKLYPDKNEFSKHFQCVLRCVLASEKLIDEDFKVTNKTVEDFFAESVPEKYIHVGHLLMDDCITEWAPKLDPKEPTCSSYGHFVECMQASAGDACSS